MKHWGTRCERRPAVDKVSRLGETPFAVEGVWTFSAVTKYQQRIEWDALVIEGNDGLHINGKDFHEQYKTSISIATKELTYNVTAWKWYCISSVAVAAPAQTGPLTDEERIDTGALSVEDQALVLNLLRHLPNLLRKR
ncbi:hypothetical protein PybrP1_012006 [[Pythium] brassicae (nom. inval.)]|nr:hypothetical protein PybrP1_012006 [[Pythium] brassicae (nom. inval.)]